MASGERETTLDALDRIPAGLLVRIAFQTGDYTEASVRLRDGLGDRPAIAVGFGAHSTPTGAINLAALDALRQLDARRA